MFYDRGNAYLKLENIEKACSDWKIAIEKGYDVEVDIWLIGTELHLGHDLPQYQVDKDWLLSNRERIWFHCKNLEILNYFIKEKKDYQFFWHQEDDFTLTSNGYIWTFPGKEVMKNSIIVSLGRENIVHEVYGICSDYVDYLN